MPGAATLSTPDLWTQSFQWLRESRTIPIFIGRNWGFQPQSLGRGHTLSNGEAASPQPAVGPGNPPTHPQTAPAHRSPRRGPQHHWNLLVSSHPCPPPVWGQQKTNAETETLARPLPTEVIFGLHRNREMMLKPISYKGIGPWEDPKCTLSDMARHWIDTRLQCHIAGLRIC